MATFAHPHLEPTEFIALQSCAGWRIAVEVIDGEAVVMPPSCAPASLVQGELFFALRGWQENKADEGLLLQAVFVELLGHQFLAPEVAWWSATRRPAIRAGAIDVVPELAVEVLSPATRMNDLGVKRDYSLDVAVCELWLADPAAKTLVRARLSSSDEELASADTLTSTLLPGFSLALVQVFRAE